MTQESDKTLKSLAQYHLLGRSGLRVSPLCMGTMTFGQDEQKKDKKENRSIYERFIEAGGNFFDTADLYTGGRSEEVLGELMKEDGNRDELVVATKFNFNQRPGRDPNAGGNGRKHIMEAVEASLRRLQTDYIDLYWMHAWDTMTPIEEVVYTLDKLVEQGKIRYAGFSDTPAWYCASAKTMADLRLFAPIVALQLEYSLIRRDIEYEFAPMAQNLGLGICPWSPLGGGMLTGKYTREKLGEGRLKQAKDSPNPVFDNINERNFQVVDALLEVAEEIGKHPAQVALNWVTTRPGVSSTIIGATKMSQLESNIASLEFELPAEARAKLEEASNPGRKTPYMFHEGFLLGMTLGQRPVTREPRWFR